MARANRHYIPGYVWHITHRCHKREFLLKFVRERRRWLQWLFEAKKRFGARIPYCIVTSSGLLLLTLVPWNLSDSYVEPFKMGQGRYLDQKEMKTFFEGIESSQPESFRKAFSEVLGNLLVSLFEYNNSDIAKFQVIEFTKFELRVAGLEKSKSHGPYYMLCVNCQEGIPKADLIKRKKAKGKYYDIWVLSGPYILIEKDSKTREYRLLDSGYAE